MTGDERTALEGMLADILAINPSFDPNNDLCRRVAVARDAVADELPTPPKADFLRGPEDYILEFFRRMRVRDPRLVGFGDQELEFLLLLYAMAARGEGGQP